MAGDTGQVCTVLCDVEDDGEEGFDAGKNGSSQIEAHLDGGWHALSHTCLPHVLQIYTNLGLRKTSVFVRKWSEESGDIF